VDHLGGLGIHPNAAGYAQYVQALD